MLNELTSLLEVLQVYELAAQETATLNGVAHDTLVAATNDFLFHHSPKFRIGSSSNIVQGLRDSGVDSVFRYKSSGLTRQFGIQIKSTGDFGRDQEFRRNVMAQISESQKYRLSHLLLGLAGDLTNASHREKARGILADVAQMRDEYVVAISPEKMAGIWHWRQGLIVAPLEQMQNAGYSWLTATYDSLGNLNRNPWGKGTGGDWSHQKCNTVYVGRQITIKAVAQSPENAPLEYRFSVQRSGQSFEVRQDWSENDTWTWSVQPADIGRWVCVMIAVRTPKQY